jgi:hypothetical protein
MSTASALEREIQCPASAVISPTVQESGEYAERGSEIHTFCRSVIAGTPRALALAALTNPHWRETCEQIDFGILCGGILNVRAEVAYRINTETDEARFLGINLGRKYPPRAANDVDGTNDFEGTRPFTGLWVVTDIKTGFWPVTLCRDNPQMKFHAKALMLLHDVDKVEARIAYIAVDGQIAFDSHVFSRLELDLFGDEFVARRGRIDRANEALRTMGRVDVSAGAWCTYCPAKVACPKFTSLAKAMLPELRDVHARWGAMTGEEKATAFLMAYEARDLAERIVESMKALARDTPIDLPGGKVLRETSSGVRVVNAERPTRRRRVA